jgi:ferritin-like metal-binding protein YciE
VTARDYLASRSWQMLKLEGDTLEIIKQVEHDVVSPPLKQVAAHYREITETQIANLKHIVDLLGGEKKIREGERGMLRLAESLGMGRENHPVTQAMIREYDAFKRANPPRNLIELNHALQVFRLQHLENASYLALVPLARLLGEADVERLLEQNRELEVGAAQMLQEHLASLIEALISGEERKAA